MQKRNLRYLVLGLLAALTSGAFCLGNEDKIGPESLLTQALKLEDLWSEGTPTVKVRTEIKILYSDGKTAPGYYVVTWISPSRWGDELEFSNYQRVRVHDANGYWQQSSLGYTPLIIFELDSILNFIPMLKIQPTESLDEVKTREKDGVRQNCAVIKRAKETDRVLCFDSTNGGLVSIEHPMAENQDPPEISRVEYSEFKNLGDKLIPYQIHAFRGRKMTVTAGITEMTPTADADPGLFTPPTNSDFWPVCKELQSAKLVKHVQPIYPTSARSNHEEGTVDLPWIV